MAVFTSEITVSLIQQMGGDHMIVAAAKVSTSGEEAATFATIEATSSNFGLINYLIKHRHGTPFEHGALTFFVKAPIFVWREWHRHRIGFCLAGDTEIWNESIAKNCGRTIRKRKIKDLYDVWVNGVHDSLGRVRFLPSVRQQKLRVLNENTGFFELGSIDDVIQSGIKECLLVETEHKKGWSIKCSKDHRILTSEGWVKAGDLTGSEYIAVVGKKSAFEHRQIPPALRAGIGVWTSMQRASLILKDSNCYICGGLFCKENLVLDHVVSVAENLKLALDVANLKPTCLACHRLKTNGEQLLANRCNLAGAKFVRLKRKPIVVSEEMTYDICMKAPWHNFVANGIVVHNSYNEESGRYKQLEPVFWIPPADRKLLPAPDYKAARPVFVSADEETYQWLVEDMKEGYLDAYARYERRLKKGIAKEVSRAGLPVGIYSSCWVTCNPRSLMSFLSLRTHEPSAKFVSYPQAEIEVAARVAEQFLATGWPLAYKAFCENGRVGP